MSDKKDQKNINIENKMIMFMILKQKHLILIVVFPPLIVHNTDSVVSV